MTQTSSEWRHRVFPTHFSSHPGREGTVYQFAWKGVKEIENIHFLKGVQSREWGKAVGNYSKNCHAFGSLPEADDVHVQVLDSSGKPLPQAKIEVKLAFPTPSWDGEQAPMPVHVDDS